MRLDFWLLLPALATWASIALAATDRSDRYCFFACRNSLQPVRFNDTSARASKLVRACQSRLGLTSLYLCTDIRCSGEDRTAGLDRLNETCQKYVATALPPFNIIANYTADDRSQLRRLDYDETLDPLVLGEVAIPSDNYFALWYDTLDATDYVNRYHLVYGVAMFVFWTAVVAIGLSYRLVSSLRKDRHESRLSPGRETYSSDHHTSDKSEAFRRRPHMWIKRYLTVPATFGYKSSQDYGWYTIPPRVQSCTILAFILLNTALCIDGYRFIPDNIYFPTLYKQFWRYVSDRTGILSFANFPIIWMFGMRNNLLLWLTGWDFGTYNNFHRWVARVATLQAVIHSVGYTILVFDDGGWPYFVSWWSYTFWWTGELATIFMCMLFGLSMYWMRRKVYEVFLLLHIGLSILMLVTMWWHVSIFKGRYDGLVWACVYVWVLDRLVRALRILAFNRKFWGTNAKATFNTDSNIIRLIISRSTSLYDPKPGTFYYLSVMNDIRGWESHPFTMASSSQIDRHSEIQQLPQQRGSVDGEQEALLQLPSDEGDGTVDSTMTFLIRPYDSFTSRLRNAATSKWPFIRVLVEGPYGHTQPFHKFDNVLFLVGGSGIVVPLSYLKTLTSSTSRTSSVKIIWAAREANFAAEVLSEDLKSFLGNDKLSVDIYLTQDEGTVFDCPKEARTFYGRPDVEDEVNDAAHGTDGGSLAVVTCGPAKLADDARRVVVDLLGKGHSRIEYFEESFKW